MEKSNGNMYKGVETFNPLGGECPHKCPYCSTKKFMRYPQFKEKYFGALRLHEPAFKPLGKGKTIFVCAQNDLFANGVQFEWIDMIFEHCIKYPDNTYMIQTKNTYNLWNWYNRTNLVIPSNFIFGTTIESNYYEVCRNFSGGNQFSRRVEYLSRIKHEKFVTVEPILQFDLTPMVNLIKQAKPSKVFIGADSGKNHLPEPLKQEVTELICELMKFTDVESKNNLTRLLK